MNELFSHYLEAFRTSVIINPIGEHQFSSPSRRNRIDDPEDLRVFHLLHYDGRGLPTCNCEAGRFNHPCAHAAACVAYVHPEIQRLWDHRRMYEAKHRALLIRQGKTNPRSYPKIRKAMDEINERHPRIAPLPLCTRCGLVQANDRSDDLCATCCADLRKIWPDSLEFARELEQQDSDERWRLKLGMGE